MIEPGGRLTWPRSDRVTNYLREFLGHCVAGERLTHPRTTGSSDRRTESLVVQDSYYKEQHFDLPQIVDEIGHSLGRSAERVDYPVARTKAAIHPGSRSYRTSFTATESLVVLRT